MTAARWESERRSAWLRTARWHVPHEARVTDGISRRLVLFTQGAWPHVPYDLGVAKAGRLYAEDVAAVETFREEHPAMAAQVADLLQTWLEDLAVLAAACRIRDGADVVRELLADETTFEERLLVPGRRR